MESWKEQMASFVNTQEKIARYIDLTSWEQAYLKTCSTRWGTTPYFASLMDPADPGCPVRKQVVPSVLEAESGDSSRGYLVSKENRNNREQRPDTIARQYHDRVAFTVSSVCASYCRHCFRKEVVTDQSLKLQLDVDQGLQWIREHREIRDVLITGGDPFLLSDDALEYILEKTREISHVKLLRFGTRTPVVLPQRITPALEKILGREHRVPIWLNTQCNHPAEITEKTAGAVLALLKCGINVGNQAVLLKGINDNAAALQQLHRKLVQIRIRPYYLFHCEPAPGIDHFRTPVDQGAKLVADCLQGHTTGLCSPMYVVDTEVGKIPLLPEYIRSRQGGAYTLVNHRGQTAVYR